MYINRKHIHNKRKTMADQSEVSQAANIVVSFLVFMTSLFSLVISDRSNQKLFS